VAKLVGSAAEDWSSLNWQLVTSLGLLLFPKTSVDRVTLEGNPFDTFNARHKRVTVRLVRIEPLQEVAESFPVAARRG
jgi:hypothetical protein